MQDIKLIKTADRAGKTLSSKVIGGRLYPNFDDDNLRNCFTFTARPDDILLCTHSKAGTHWTFEIIRFLLAGTTDLSVGVRKEDGMIEHKNPSSLDELPSPRNINTHYHFGGISPDFLRQKCKIIHVVRDPRDIVVSLFNHEAAYDYEGTWSDFFPLFMEGKVDYGSYFEYTKGFEKGMKDNPDHPFLVLVYEAMLQNPLKDIKRIADFIGVNRSEDFLNEVVQKTSFKSMKAARGSEAAMFRKGKSGDWKNWFTVAQSDYFNQVFEKEMQGTDAHKLYSHNIPYQIDHNAN